MTDGRSVVFKFSVLYFSFVASTSHKLEIHVFVNVRPFIDNENQPISTREFLQLPFLVYSFLLLPFTIIPSKRIRSVLEHTPNWIG